jgi:plasmid stabilization system protein ParE
MGSEFRELPIDFGDTGYIALYRFEHDAVIVLAIRHQKEAGY